MTSLVIGIVLIVGGLAFAAFPLLRRSPDASGEPSPPDTRRGGGEPMAAMPAPLAAIASEREELELDRAMGKLSDADYARLRAALDARARNAMTATTSTDLPEPPTSLDAALTQATDAASPPRVDGDESMALAEQAERLVRRERERAVHCTTCGQRPEPAARFCSTCGRAIGGCPSCGAPVREAGARFCDQCGHALAGAGA